MELGDGEDEVELEVDEAVEEAEDIDILDADDADIIEDMDIIADVEEGIMEELPEWAAFLPLL